MLDDMTLFGFTLRGRLGAETLATLREPLELDITAGKPGHELAEAAIGDHADLYITEIERHACWRIEALAAPKAPVDRDAVDAVRTQLLALLPELGVSWEEDA